MNPKLEEMLKTFRNHVRDKVFWAWRYVVLEGKIDELVSITPSIPVEYRFGDLSDIDRMDNEHHEYDAEAKKYAVECFEAGGRMIVGCYNGHIVFYMWLMFHAMDIDYRNYFPTSSNLVYTYKAFTVKGYRGKQIFAGVYTLVTDYMKQMGYKKTIGLIDVNNHHSMRSNIKVGCRPIGSIIKIRVLSKSIYLISNRLSSHLRDVGM